MPGKALIGLVVASLSIGAWAQTSAADLVKARQVGMKSIGSNFKGLMDATRGTPDAATVQRHAAAIAVEAPKVSAWFGPGTMPPPGSKTRARAEIWAQSAAFRKASADFDAQAKRTLAVANAGDMTALGPQVQALGGTCKGCHDQFRTKE